MNNISKVFFLFAAVSFAVSATIMEIEQRETQYAAISQAEQDAFLTGAERCSWVELRCY